VEVGNAGVEAEDVGVKGRGGVAKVGCDERGTAEGTAQKAYAAGAFWRRVAMGREKVKSILQGLLIGG
jgi:hypothetical protein